MPNLGGVIVTKTRILAAINTDFLLCVNLEKPRSIVS